MIEVQSIAPIRARLGIIDQTRGLALVGVIFYHFMFDLRLLEFTTLDVTYDFAWVTFARILSGSFLFLAGFSLVLAHGNAVRWPAFWRRFGIVGLAALAISAVTYLTFPDTWVHFGVLHAIALFSVLALPFLKQKYWLTLIAAALVFGLPFVFADPLFNQRLWSVIGLWVVPPLTGDLVPIFPSFGFTLVGVAAGRFMRDKDLLPRLTSSLSGHPGIALTWLGRRSLWVYLLHQPILLAALFGLAQLTHPETDIRRDLFIGSCFSTCLELRANAPYCQAYCQCGLEMVERENLWAAINAPEPTLEQQSAAGRITQTCTTKLSESDLLGG